MKSTLKLKALGAAVAALVAGALPMAANADALAQSILNVENFTFRAGNGGLGIGSILAGISIVATTTADAAAELNGVTDPGSLIIGGEKAVVGAVGFYSPGTRILSPTPPPATYVGSQATQIGNAIGATASARVDNTVSLKPAGDGTAQGNVNLNSEFLVTVSVAGTKLETRFDADSFLRAHLTATGTATASYSWVMTLVDQSSGAEVFSWTPNGLVGAIDGGTEYADAFRMTNSRSIITANDVFVNNATGTFEAETDGLAAGTYLLSIRHTGNADATLVPEPGSLALLGTLLFGAALTTRRRSSDKK